MIAITQPSIKKFNLINNYNKNKIIPRTNNPPIDSVYKIILKVNLPVSIA